jgi:hypothetical protein
MDNKALVLDLVEWVGREPKTYDQVMDAWRTSCPRLQVWEDAVDHGLLRRYCEETDKTMIPMVKVTSRGQAFLRENSRA